MTNNFKKSWVAAALVVGTSFGSLQAQVLRKVSANKGEAKATQGREMQINRSGAVSTLKGKGKVVKATSLVNSIAGSAVKKTNDFKKFNYSGNANANAQTMAATCIDMATSSYANGFETVADTIGLRIVDANADNTKWIFASSATLAHSGTGFMIYQYSTTSAANDWFTVRCVSLQAGQSYKLSFYYRVGEAAYPENLKVAVGTSATPAAMTTTLLNLPGITNETYQQAEATFTPTTAGNYYFGFQAYSAADMYRLIVDDISITKVASNDLAVTNIKYPDSQCGMGAGDVTVFVKNNGSAAVTTADLSLAINTATQVGTISNLAAGATDSVTFSVDFSIPGDYVMQATAILAGDADASNDTSATVGVSHLEPVNLSTGAYTNSFETDEDYLGMTRLDENNDGVSWYASTLLPHTGSTCLAYLYNDNGTTAANDWLVTKCLNFEAGKSYKLSFWYRNSDSTYAPEKMLVAYGNAPTAAALTNVLVDLPNIINHKAYQQAEVTFTPTVSGTYYIGFKAYTDANKWRLYLDDVELKELSGSDVGAVALVAPKSCSGSGQVVAVAVKNYGLDATNIPVTVEFTGATTTSISDVLPSLAAGATDTLYFSTTVDLTTEGTVFVKAYTVVAGDTDPSNDAKYDTLNVVFPTAIPYSENYNAITAGELPTGWTSGDEEFYTEAGRGVGNTNVLYLNLYSNASSATTHGELYSPAFSGFTGTQYISFFYKLINYSGGAPYSLAAGDSLQIEYSTDCGATFTRLTSINASTFTSSAAYKVMRFPLAALGTVDNVKFRFVGTYGGNGDYIHLIDNLEIGDVPNNDLAVINLTSNAKYTITPKAHVPAAGFTFNSTVLNSGMNATTNVVSKIKVTPGTYADSTSFATLASTASSAFTPAAAFTPTESGEYVVTASAYASEAETNTSNNSITLPLAISDSTMAKDHNAAVGGLGIGSGTADGIFQKYELKYGAGLQDTLTSVTFWIGDIQTPTTVKAMVYRATSTGGLNANTAALDSTAALTIPVEEANQFHTISFKKANGLGTILTATTANNSRYFVGLREKANNMRLGFEVPTSYTVNDVLIRLNGAWTDPSSPNLLGAGVTFYIRPNFGKYTPVVGVAKVNNSLNVAAYPNPTTGLLNLAFDRNEIQPTAVKVVNVLGATVAEITNASELAGEKVTLNLAGQSAGTYFVHIATQDNVVIRKVVLNR
ncbi:Por secretion system C-terminal sorting domain-containing protein [Flexibacter flexilis DSM 6793]|uniref:Por secretion system C-terminal sorting domain-containing protein n=1 Tax=Flexibacter flexilis DSM 6793 TaxID=927664 RepID=A0A1I1KHX7_9BACT|nr:choice-of-anchor J domain-containing protein [Flexibacter flexilis]SFC59892.1 Por secretion system C-terminal sorting domain-containing protein [Flexibacter flexilis DSM 6793]